MAGQVIRVFPQDLNTLAGTFAQGRQDVQSLEAMLASVKNDVMQAFANHPDQAADPLAALDKTRQPFADLDNALQQVAQALNAVAELYPVSDGAAARGLRPGNAF